MTYTKIIIVRGDVLTLHSSLLGLKNKKRYDEITFRNGAVAVQYIQVIIILKKIMKSIQNSNKYRIQKFSDLYYECDE